MLGRSGGYYELSAALTTDGNNFGICFKRRSTASARSHTIERRETSFDRFKQIQTTTENVLRLSTSTLQSLLARKLLYVIKRLEYMYLFFNGCLY